MSGERCGHGIYEKFSQCIENQKTWSDDKVDYSAGLTDCCCCSWVNEWMQMSK